ncbi:hypothetical protein TRFO_12646 [Tritrichomonas foetus]|uniref:RRM domain-containing protein n=1 Tax=Tritrichomonas foetus TaxID=1144522 RepID=A0A1J4L111_9EUKA|nr:hypothetical protein TRFO_12646 [Tritrichomonas foetus]|eukprot:OHT17123.1 hypothetical protein TRFO_12646 [Tritrichomonas foetus]
MRKYGVVITPINHINPDSLKSVFETCGKIESMSFVEENGKKIQCHIFYSTPGAANQAVKSFDGQTFIGKIVTVIRCDEENPQDIGLYHKNIHATSEKKSKISNVQTDQSKNMKVNENKHISKNSETRNESNTDTRNEKLGKLNKNDITSEKEANSTKNDTPAEINESELKRQKENRNESIPPKMETHKDSQKDDILSKNAEEECNESAPEYNDYSSSSESDSYSDEKRHKKSNHRHRKHHHKPSRHSHHHHRHHHHHRRRH